QSEWAVISFNTSENNILLPISAEDLVNTSVSLRWDFVVADTDNSSNTVTKVVLKPFVGPATEYTLSAQHVQEKQLKIDGLQKDMQYRATIYNGSFAMGKRDFITAAEAVNGVWTLSPYSDLAGAISKSAHGDKILLRAGVYDLSTVVPSLENKSITIEALPSQDAEKPKLYARGFTMTGTSSGLAFRGLDISGSRINEYDQELSNSQDHLWNNWLITLDVASAGFDAISFDDCIIRNYWAGIFNMNDTNRPPHKVGNSIAINNSIVHHLGGNNEAHTFHTRAGQVKKGTFTNSTYYLTNISFISIDAERNKANVVDFEFSNNTVDRSWSAGAFDFKEVKSPSTFVLKNNILSNMTSAANFFNNFAYTANDFNKQLINTNFFNVRSKSTIYGSNSSNMPVHTWELRHPNTRWNTVVPAFIMNDAQHANPNSIKEYTVSYDPGYTNAQGGDFTVAAGSALRTVDGGKAIGDPRWW
ncbi:MAG: DUF4957 domain-containing protein, partial [Pedobacter sp.]